MLRLFSRRKDSGHLYAALEGRGQSYRYDAKNHDATRGLGGSLLKCALCAVKASADEGHAKDKEDVGQDGPDQRGLHDAKLTLDESDDTDDELNGDAKGGVQEAAESRSQLERRLLGSVTQQLRRRERVSMVRRRR